MSHVLILEVGSRLSDGRPSPFFFFYANVSWFQEEFKGISEYSARLMEMA